MFRTSLSPDLSFGVAFSVIKKTNCEKRSFFEKIFQKSRYFFDKLLIYGEKYIKIWVRAFLLEL